MTMALSEDLEAEQFTLSPPEEPPPPPPPLQSATAAPEPEPCEHPWRQVSLVGREGRLGLRCSCGELLQMSGWPLLFDLVK